jgi:2-dehydro-3-deoxyglucarate aldolase
VAATRYPPQGVRGVSVSQRGNRYGTVPDYFKNVNEQICVMVQIESRKGVEAAREIAALDGVDCIFVGPSDLAAGFGHLGNAGHPKCRLRLLLCLRMPRRMANHGHPGAGGGGCSSLYGDGCHLCGVGSDLGVFRSGTQALLDKYRV